MKRIIIPLTAASLALAFLSCSGGDGQVVQRQAPAVHVTGLSLNKTSISLYVDSQETLVPTIQPSNATNKSVSWASSDASIASVSNGMVTAVAPGTATITATTQDGGKTATCKVTVSKRTVAVTGVSLNKTTLTLTVGSSETLVATVRPDNATNKDVIWSSFNTYSATVDNGTVTAHSRGTATIRATTASGGYSASCSVTVADVPVTGVYLDKTSITLRAGKSETLTATINPTNATNKDVIWSSDAAYIARVSYGVVTAGNTTGTTTIRVATVSGNHTASCKVTVTVPVTEVSLNKSALAFQIGDTEKLTATIQPYNPTNKTIVWSSSDSSVATVTNDGQVAAKGRGAATITAASQDGGAYATCSVTVADVYVAGYYINNRGNNVATLWTNGRRKDLTDGSSEAVAESVYVSGQDVYVAGYERSASRRFVAKVWKNGSLYQSLNDDSYDAGAYFICVSNNNVYVAGREYNDQGDTVATLWTNGKARHLADGAYSSHASSVTVSGSDVYVAGWASDATREQAVVWKNGESWVLGSQEANASASTVVVANGRVYVAGTEMTAPSTQNAVLWTDGKYQKVSGNEYRARAHGLSVEGGNVYVSGQALIYPDNRYGYGMVWKNGEGQRLGFTLDLSHGCFARSVSVLRGNVFAAGTQRSFFDEDNAIMWVNGVGVNLDGSTSEARGIFVR